MTKHYIVELKQETWQNTIS